MSTSSSVDVSKDVIYLMLDVGHQVDIAYDQDLKGLLALVGDTGEHKAVIGIKQLLIKEGYNIQNSKINILLDIGNNFGL